MNGLIYKSKEGKAIIESLYREILAQHSSPAFEQLYIATKHAKTHVLRFGDTSKPPLLMLHGSTSNSATWLGNVAEFTGNFCVYCVDIPGEPGLSETKRMPLNSNAPTEWLVSLLDELDIRKASFLGMSLGSWYALNFALRHPQRIKALSLITSSGIAPARKSFIFKAIFYMMLGKAGQKLLNKALYHHTEVPAEVLNFQAVISKHFNPLMEEIPIFSDDMLMTLQAPLQYLGGDHDALLDSQETEERLKKLVPHADIKILNDTGHVIIDQFSTVKDFLISHAVK